uniref:Pentatricopeptide repeat-containing protein n=1 Tax=Quercus lobata TaxID=97700 RepID=A0A7N2MSZ0_QUELO
MSSSGFIMDEFTLGCFAQSLCKAGRWREALSLFEKEEIVPNTVLYTKMISGLCEASLFEEAMDFFNRMRTSSCIPNIVTYRTLLCGCLRKRQLGYVVYNILIGGICGNEELPSSDVLELAEKAYGEMLDVGVVLNKVNVSNFARCLCGAGKFERAYTVIREMMSKGFIPDTSTYAKVIGFLCNASKVEKAFLLFDEIKRNGLCKAHKVKEARNLLDAMSVEGCEPNHIVHDALVDGFCKSGKLDDAQEDKRLDLALKVLSKMLENSCAPNVVIYTEMIDGLCKVGKTDEAYKLVLMMEEKGCYPNVVTYTAMIDGFGKVSKVKKCLDLLREMGSKGCAPNFVTYRVLRNHCCATGLLDEAHKLLDEMKQTYWPRHISSYRKVIEGFNREFIISLGLLDEISENDSVPIVPVYRILIDSFIKAGRLELALELHEDIPSFFPLKAASKNMYTSLIESLSRAGKVV